MSAPSRLKPKSPDREEYFALFVAALAKRGAVPAMTDVDAFMLRMPEGNTVYLDNGFTEYSKARPADRKTLLDRFVSVAMAKHKTESTYLEVKSTLLPVLRADSYISLMALGSNANDAATNERIASVPFARGLILALVRDLPESMMFVNRSAVQGWHVTVEQAMGTALANLRGSTDGPEFEETSPGLFRGVWADGYSASRVTLPELFEHLVIDGDPVFFAPTRAQLWVTGHRDVINQAHMLKLGEQSHFESYPLSPNLYRLADGAWDMYEPEDAAVDSLLHGLQERRANLDYNQQKKLLDFLFERDRQDIFVATHNLYEDSTGRLFSMCVWTEGADSLLPATDRIVLFRKGKPNRQINLPWQVVVPHVEDLMEGDFSHVPIRYRVREFPSEAQWQELLALQESGNQPGQALQ